MYNNAFTEVSIIYEKIYLMEIKSAILCTFSNLQYADGVTFPDWRSTAKMLVISWNYYEWIYIIINWFLSRLLLVFYRTSIELNF